MSKCESCEHFEYKAGISSSLQKISGITGHPTSATCYCILVGWSWRRYSAEIKKPRGIKCEYSMKEMHCTKCAKLLKNSNDIWLKITKDTFICKKCGKKKEDATEKGE